MAWIIEVQYVRTHADRHRLMCPWQLPSPAQDVWQPHQPFPLPSSSPPTTTRLLSELSPLPLSHHHSGIHCDACCAPDYRLPCLTGSPCPCPPARLCVSKSAALCEPVCAHIRTRPRLQRGPIAFSLPAPAPTAGESTAAGLPSPACLRYRNLSRALCCATTRAAHGGQGNWDVAPDMRATALKDHTTNTTVHARTHAPKRGRSQGSKKARQGGKPT
jgi:hypothetical protein